MCGIAGAVFKDKTFSQKALFEQALTMLKHRGPDNAGSYFNKNIWLGHTRLSIIDLSPEANQPMLNYDKSFAIAYNGEVYNFRDLESKYQLEGLKTKSDTEVVLESFIKYGGTVFEDLNGMFAFAICDVKKNELTLVRDRLGIKPLYYYNDSKIFAFASEIKALQVLIGQKIDCNIASIHEWMYYGNSLGGKTMFKEIKQVPPGHTLVFDIENFDFKLNTYWKLDGKTTPYKLKDADKLAQKVSDYLEQAVKRQLVSDVPVGIFLSGGIDSSAITAYASKHYHGKISTYSVGFDDPMFKDERPKAKKVAAHYGTNHHELYISGTDVQFVIEDLIDHHGVPFFDAANIPLYLMAKEVSKDVKVVLQGDGGDEVFGGYRRYHSIRYRHLLHVAAKFGKGPISIFPDSLKKQRIMRYLNIYDNSDLGNIIASLLTGEGYDHTLLTLFKEPYRSEIASFNPIAHYLKVQKSFKVADPGQQLSMVDLSIILPDIYLEKVDRSTMAHSLEVRVPFLDHDLVDFMSTIPGYIKMPKGKKKWLLKKALRGVVPDFVLDAPKAGFDVPFSLWLFGPLRPHFYGNLDDFQRSNSNFFNKEVIDQWFKETETKKKDHSTRLWKIYQFILWANRFNVSINI
jgi:asparagine synthase (glutamine-hydrolysing)